MYQLFVYIAQLHHWWPGPWGLKLIIFFSVQAWICWRKLTFYVNWRWFKPSFMLTEGWRVDQLILSFRPHFARSLIYLLNCSYFWYLKYFVKFRSTSGYYSNLFVVFIVTKKRCLVPIRTVKFLLRYFWFTYILKLSNLE